MAGHLLEEAASAYRACLTVRLEASKELTIVTMQNLIARAGGAQPKTRELRTDSDRNLVTLLKWHVDLSKLHTETARTQHSEIQFLLGMLIFAVEDAIGAISAL